MGGYDAPELFGPFANDQEAKDWAAHVSDALDCVIFDLNSASSPTS